MDDLMGDRMGKAFQQTSSMSSGLTKAHLGVFSMNGNIGGNLDDIGIPGLYNPGTRRAPPVQSRSEDVMVGGPRAEVPARKLPATTLPATKLPKYTPVTTEEEFDGDLIVGDEPCTYVSICEALSQSNTAGNFWRHLVDLARSLGSPEDRVIMFNQRLSAGNTTHSSVLHEMLESWRGKHSKNAKLSSLIITLENKGLKDSADVLRQKFYE